MNILKDTVDALPRFVGDEDRRDGEGTDGHVAGRHRQQGTNDLAPLLLLPLAG